MPVRTLDAMRISDNTQVVVKILIPSNEDRHGAEELEILQRLSSESHRSDLANHAVPCLDSFPIPGVENGIFYVMPLLKEYDDPPFYNLQEIYDFIVQAFEGVRFLHENDIVHCDIASTNILMDGRALYDEPFHPFNQHRTLDITRSIRPRYTRSQINVRYYFIDFGYAKWFRDPNEPRLVTGIHARERTPEQLSGEPYDPFKADVYQLGAVLRRDLIPNHPIIQFLLPLTREMTHDDPDRRPTLVQARRSLDTQFVGLQGWKMRWPIIPSGASLPQQLGYGLAGVTAEFVWFWRRILRVLLLRGN